MREGRHRLTQGTPCEHTKREGSADERWSPTGEVAIGNLNKVTENSNLKNDYKRSYADVLTNSKKK